MQSLDNAGAPQHSNAFPSASTPSWPTHPDHPPSSSPWTMILPKSGARLVLRAASDATGTAIDPDDHADALSVPFDADDVRGHAARLLERGADQAVGVALQDLLKTGERDALSDAARRALAEFPLFLGAAGLPDPEAPSEHAAQSDDITHRAIARLLLVLAGEDPLRLERRDGRVTVDRACGHMVAQMGEPLALDDLVRFTGTSSRTLQYAFLARFGVSPMRWLREQRLRRLHAALREAPADRGVTELAVEVGFTHLGRVGQLFEQRFGLLPSHLLRRARRG